VQEFARPDPRRFLAERRDGAILDEVHRVPELLAYLQPLVDEIRGTGRFVLTGSANFALLQSLGQPLAGRTALLELLPLSLEEVRRFPEPPRDLLELLCRGSAPAVYDRDLEPGEWSYVATYVERDVRIILNVGSDRLPNLPPTLRRSATSSTRASSATCSASAPPISYASIRSAAVVAYGGDTAQDRSDGAVVPWSALDEQTWWDR
jgi:predicted AAA+ superfamily ATPase